MTHVQKVMAEYGFTAVQTGGGCMAYRKDNADGSYFMITDESGCGLPEDVNGMMLVGFYKDVDDEGSVDEVSFYDFEGHFLV